MKTSLALVPLLVLLLGWHHTTASWQTSRCKKVTNYYFRNCAGGQSFDLCELVKKRLERHSCKPVCNIDHKEECVDKGDSCPDNGNACPYYYKCCSIVDTTTSTSITTTLSTSIPSTTVTTSPTTVSTTATTPTTTVTTTETETPTTVTTTETETPTTVTTTETETPTTVTTTETETPTTVTTTETETPTTVTTTETETPTTVTTTETETPTTVTTTEPETFTTVTTTETKTPSTVTTTPTQSTTTSDTTTGSTTLTTTSTMTTTTMTKTTYKPETCSRRGKNYVCRHKSRDCEFGHAVYHEACPDDKVCCYEACDSSYGYSCMPIAGNCQSRVYSRQGYRPCYPAHLCCVSGYTRYAKPRAKKDCCFIKYPRSRYEAYVFQSFVRRGRTIKIRPVYH